ncbi:MAG: hypothetical protein QGG25_04040 [Phycisphaerae bacterium]|nr:hypothetical protein [Phycisphaerae bacterium]
MRTCVTIACVLAVLASIGLGDDVSVGKLTYSGATIVEVRDGLLVFKTPGGRTQLKPFSEITGILLTGLDSFNEAEKLVSQTAGKTPGVKTLKKIEAKKAEISDIMAEIADPAGAIAKLKASAKRTETQAAAYKKSADALGKQVAELKKTDSSASSKFAKLRVEVNKLNAKADALQKRGKKGEANQLRNQARQMAKQLESQDAARIKASAAKKRADATRIAREAGRIRSQRKKDWKKQYDNKVKVAKRLSDEAATLETQAKRLVGAGAARKAQIAKLTKERSSLLRQAVKSKAEAKSLEAQAKNFPVFAKTQKAKAVKLDAEVVELKASLDKMASATTEKSDNFPAAIRLYRTASGLNGTPAQKAIIDFRLLSALDRAGWIDEAAAQWLVMADKANGSPGVLACRPETMASKGDTRNAKAIIVLKSGLTKIKVSQYKASAVDLLVRLMLREGRHDDVISLLANPSNPKLKVVKAIALLKKKAHAASAKVITDALNELDKESLAEALSVRAKALLGQSATITDTDERQDMMLDAALDFMRVATYFPGALSAGESLYQAGKIMISLPKKPNKIAAVRAYQAVAANHAGTPIGKAASAELTRLGAK